MPEGLPCSTLYICIEIQFIFSLSAGVSLEFLYSIPKMTRNAVVKTVLNAAEDPKHLPIGIYEETSIKY